MHTQSQCVWSGSAGSRLLICTGSRRPAARQNNLSQQTECIHSRKRYLLRSSPVLQTSEEPTVVFVIQPGRPSIPPTSRRSRRGRRHHRIKSHKHTRCGLQIPCRHKLQMRRNTGWWTRENCECFCRGENSKYLIQIHSRLSSSSRTRPRQVCIVAVSVHSQWQPESRAQMDTSPRRRKRTRVHSHMWPERSQTQLCLQCKQRRSPLSPVLGE